MSSNICSVLNSYSVKILLYILISDVSRMPLPYYVCIDVLDGMIHWLVNGVCK